MARVVADYCLQATITFTADELKGVPKDVVGGYIKTTKDGQDLYDVTYKTPDIFPIVRPNPTAHPRTAYSHLTLRPQFKFAENPETRKRAYEGYESRLAINVPILEKFLELRRKIAKLLGYETWADYITEVKMVKNAKGVKQVRLFSPPLQPQLCR